MKTCPKCKAAIDYLDYLAIDEVGGYFGGEYSEKSGDRLRCQYFCPQCKQKVANGEYEAKKILGIK